jgi:hypothetical protein
MKNKNHFASINSQNNKHPRKKRKNEKLKYQIKTQPCNKNMKVQKCFTNSSKIKFKLFFVPLHSCGSIAFAK